MDSNDYYKWKEENKGVIYNRNSAFFSLSIKYLNKTYKELIISFNEEKNTSLSYILFKKLNKNISILEDNFKVNYFNKLFDISYNFSNSYHLKSHAEYFLDEKNKFNKTGIITEEIFCYFKDFLYFYIKDINEIAETDPALKIKEKIDNF